MGATWAYVESMGHKTVAGKVSEEAMFGVNVLRIDAPKTSRREGFTQYYGGNAIYCTTPCDEETAVQLAEHHDAAPVSAHVVQNALLPSRVGMVSIDPQPDEVDYEDHDWDDDEEGDAGSAAQDGRVV